MVAAPCLGCLACAAIKGDRGNGARPACCRRPRALPPRARLPDLSAVSEARAGAGRGRRGRRGDAAAAAGMGVAGAGLGLLSPGGRVAGRRLWVGSSARAGRQSRAGTGRAQPSIQGREELPKSASPAPAAGRAEAEASLPEGAPQGTTRRPRASTDAQAPAEHLARLLRGYFFCTIWHGLPQAFLPGVEPPACLGTLK